MRETEAVAEARHYAEICNGCRYCEGFCAVFPALERRREFAAADLSYLANLCHNCMGCFYACQYAPPHEFGVNLPRSLALVRAESYAEYAWPAPLARAFARSGVVVSLAAACSIALVLILVTALQSPETLYAAHPVEPGAFYAVIPLWIMQVVGIASFGFALFALAKGGAAFWRDAGPRGRPGVGAIARAAWDVLTLRNLGGGGDGCNDRDERFSMTRRWLHHAMFYGFVLCFAATCVGFVYHAVLGRHAPYPLVSAPVLLGGAGGVLLLIGTVGLFSMKLTADPLPAARRLLGGDVALLMLLALSALSGLLLLALRGTGAMGIALAVHLGFILALFALLPFSKMVHGLYRSLALLRNATERRMAPLGE
jgi:citrate/tricarballylate utilization protein